jgi:hypothetical protein
MTIRVTRAIGAPIATAGECPADPRTCAWFKRLGLAGFLFFLAKGLLWLALPALLAMFGMPP